MTSIAALLAVSPTLFVAPNGDDRSTGTSRAPMRTIPAAIARLRPQHIGGKPARIFLRAGTYVMASTLELTPEDSGLTIAAERPGTVRLMGGRVLRKWNPTNDSRLDPGVRAHVVVCDLGKDEPIPDLGQMSRAGFGIGHAPAGLELFYGGQPMTLARFPNAGWIRTGKGSSDQTVTREESRRWSSTEDVWALGYWKFDWAESYERVTDQKSDRFTLSEKPVFGLDAGRRYMLLNAIEELDSPGECFLDRPARRLYFWPPKIGAEAVASTLGSTMVHVRGANDVTLKGLTLEVGRAGAVRIEGGRGNRVEACLIRNFGNDGVAIVGATDSGVVGCDLTGLGDRAITLSGGDRKTLTPAGLYADDNHIWAYSRWTRTYQPAIGIDGVGNRATRNSIHDAPHNAILLSGNDHLLEGNDVRRVCLETGDSGAFYMGRNPTMRGTVIRNNRFRDLGAKVSTEGNFTEVMSVYLDDCWPGTTIVGNVFEGPGTGIMIGGGQDNVVEGNVFVGKHPAVHLDARGRGWAKEMVLNPKEWDFPRLMNEVDGTGAIYTHRYPRLADVMQRGFGDPTGVRVIGNVAVGGDWLRLQDGLTTSDFENVGNVQLRTGTLEETLRRLAKPIDLNKIGLRTKIRPSDRG